jgi:hypothetical protein
MGSLHTGYEAEHTNWLVCVKRPNDDSVPAEA